MPEVRVPYPVIEIDGIDERSADGRRDRARSGICRNGPAEHADNAQIGGQPPLTLPEVPNAGVLPTATIDFDEVAVEVRMDRDVPTTDSCVTKNGDSGRSGQRSSPTRCVMRRTLEPSDFIM